jgi:hypothetical protein
MAVVLGAAGTASAHEFTCEKRIQVKGEGPTDEGPRVTRFPATLRFRYKVKNIHPKGESVANLVEDPLLEPHGFRFPFATPLAIGVGQEREGTFELKLSSPEACHAMAATDGRVDGHFDSVLRVKWDLGETQCGARFSCCEPFVDCEMACPEYDPDCSEGSGNNVAPGASRNAGFFKVHEQALGQCLALGRMDLGMAKVESLEQALGLLWASPGLDRHGGVRSEADARRFELAREALVTVCNERLFGMDAKRGHALDEALRTLRSSRNGDTERLVTELRRHNDAGLREPLPQGFDAGRATPAHAASLAVDPTEPGRP